MGHEVLSDRMLHCLTPSATMLVWVCMCVVWMVSSHGGSHPGWLGLKQMSLEASCQMLLVLVSQEELFIPAASAPSVSSTHIRHECQGHPLNCSFSSGIAVQHASLTTLKKKFGFSLIHTGTYAILPRVFSHPSRSLVFHHFHAHRCTKSNT